MLPGQVAIVGSDQSSPQSISVAALRLINQADLLISTPEQSGLFSQPEIKPRHRDQEIFFALSSEIENAVDKTIAACKSGDAVTWVLETKEVCRPDSGKLGAVLKTLRDAGCRIIVLPGETLAQRAVTLSGILPNGIFTYAQVSAKAVPSVGTVSICGSASEYPKASQALSGRNPNDDVLVVTGCGTMEHQSTHSTVKNFVKRVEVDEDFVVISGPGVAGANQWYENRPLHGWRVLIPTTVRRVTEGEERVSLYGGKTETIPTLAIEEPKNLTPVERCVRGLVEGDYQWIIFTTEHAVKAIIDRMTFLGLDARSFAGIRVAVTDEGAEQALIDWGITPDLIPIERNAVGLTEEFPFYDELLDPLNGVLVPTAEIATNVLSEQLTELGWNVEEVSVYRAVRAAPPPLETREAIKIGDFDAVIYTSVTAVRNMIGIAGKPHPRSIIAAIGPETANVCRELGLRVDVVSTKPSLVKLIDELASFAVNRREEIIASGKPYLKPSQIRRRRNKS